MANFHFGLVSSVSQGIASNLCCKFTNMTVRIFVLPCKQEAILPYILTSARTHSKDFEQNLFHSMKYHMYSHGASNCKLCQLNGEGWWELNMSLYPQWSMKAEADKPERRAHNFNKPILESVSVLRIVSSWMVGGAQRPHASRLSKELWTQPTQWVQGKLWAALEGSVRWVHMQGWGLLWICPAPHIPFSTSETANFANACL